MNTVENIDIFSPECLALAAYLDCEPSELDECIYDSYGMTTFDYGNQQYAIGTDEEADTACEEYIKDSVWAFNASFLASETGLPEEMFAFASEKCEDANGPILQVIEQSCGLGAFVGSAMMADGRGHFLSSYDGEEQEHGDYFIYRVN